MSVLKKTSKNTNKGIAFGMCFGVSIGTSFGVVYGNIAVGISLGISIGLALGLVIGSQKDKEVNKQIEENGYCIEDIETNVESKNYFVTIVNNRGKKIDVIITEKQMETESFNIGDIVFLNNDGLIEQAYEKDNK